MDRTQRNMLITGGAGFIGSNFAVYMKKRHPGYRLVILDKLTYAGNLENLKPVEAGANYRFVKGDISDGALVERLFEDELFDYVVNFAAESHVDRSITGPKAFIETNIGGTFTLLEAARKYWPVGAPDKRFLHVSTDEVYGSLGETGAFTEESRYMPNSPYSASKAAADHLARAYYHTYGLPVITTNCSNNYGQYQFPEKLIPLVIINALKGRELPVYGDGGNVRDWLYVEDHCNALDTALERGRPGEVYNIGGRSERRNIDIVRLVCSLVDERVGSAPELKARFPYDGRREELIRFVKDRPGHDRRYAIDSAKLETELGWRPAHTFETGIRATVDWYIGNVSWWERILSGAYRDYYASQYDERLGNGQISG